MVTESTAEETGDLWIDENGTFAFLQKEILSINPGLKDFFRAVGSSVISSEI
jgi:hypothetical protein